MGSNVRHLTGLSRGRGMAAVIAGAAAALLSTGTALAANALPTYEPPPAVIKHNHESAQKINKPRAGGGRLPVLLDHSRGAVAGRLIPGRPAMDPVTVG